MKQNLKLKEIIVIALLSALIGVVFTSLDSIYKPLETIAGPLAGDIINGLYLLSALLPMYIIRKPGSALIGSLFTGLVNLLMGSPYGIHIIIAALLQGVGVEIIIALRGYKKYSFLQMSFSAILAMLLVTARDYFVFGLSFYGSLLPVAITIRIISSIIFGAGITLALCNGLKSTGVLNGFKIGSRSDW